jgi:hypothetical protein
MNREVEVADAVVLFDLRDPDAERKALEARKAWGKHYSRLFTLDADHIVIVFKAGAAIKKRAA